MAKQDRRGVFAEAGVNHNGSLDLGCRLVDAAAEAGANAVKFQTFRADALATNDVPKAAYQEVNDDAPTQREMLRRLELTDSEHDALIHCCHENGVEFLSTAFDTESVNILRDRGMRRWKISSCDITNLPHLRHVGGFGQEVILSTGMSELREVVQAVNVLEEVGTDRSLITVLHCSTAYPTPMPEVNLRAMQTIADEIPGVGVGYSDHTAGIEVAIAAAACGALVIEKHLTLDRTLPGPDHQASLEPGEFSSMIQAIRHIEVALGNGVKRPMPSELTNRNVARRSLVAARDIAAGETFTEDNLTVKRPGSGVSPMEWDDYVGRVAQRKYKTDDLIDA